jgi:hypothetical protein
VFHQPLLLVLSEQCVVQEKKMKFNVKMIATAALAVFLMTCIQVRAEIAAKSAALTNANSVATASDTANSSATGLPLSVTAAPLTGTGLDEDTTPQAEHNSDGHRGRTPKVELFLGYSYLSAVPSASDGNRLVWLNGGSASLAYNLTRHWGLVADIGGFDDSETRITSTSTSPSVVVNSSGTVYTYLFGPRYSFRNHSRVTPFAQVLFGGIHASEVTLDSNSGCTGVGCNPLPAENSFAMTAGGGLDIRLNHHFALRLVQAEYLMTRFEDRSTGDSAMQNDMRLSSGIVFKFGGHSAPRPPPLAIALSCSVNPVSVYAGDPIMVTGASVNLNGATTPVYTWSVNGGTVTGVLSSTRIDTTGIAPGTYTLKGHVTQGAREFENADCSATYMVKVYGPPTVSCTSNPATVQYGAPSTITAVGVSPANRPLTYSYSADSGTINGTGTSTSLSTTTAAVGTVNITCNVLDDKGQSGTGTTTVVVVAPAPPPLPATSELCTIQFGRDVRRPARVDNEAKACLDEIAINLEHSTDSRIAITGNATSSEKNGRKLAPERAVNTKIYLVKEKGIDASRITVYSGTSDGATATTTLIPVGATLNVSGATEVK